MARTIHELAAIITGQIDGFQRAMSSAGKATDGLATKWTAAGKDITTAATRVGTAVGLMAGGIAGYAAKMGTSFNSAKEETVLSMTVMLGSAEKANAMFKEMQALAAATPLKTTEIATATTTLLQFGVEQEKVIGLVKQLGDVSGGNGEKLKSMALAFGQMSSAGRLMGQDLLQMINVGFNPLKEISAHTGVSMLELKKQMEAGAISTEMVEASFLRATSSGGTFFNMMAIQATSGKGLWSTFADNIETASGRMFEPLSAGLKQVTQGLIAVTADTQFTAWINTMRGEIQRVVTALMDMGKTNGTAALKAIGDGFLWAAQTSGKFVTYLKEQGPALMTAAAGWAAMLKPILQFLANNPQVVAALIALKVAGMLGLTQAVMSLGTALVSTLGVLLKLPASLTAMGAASKLAFAPMLAFFATPMGIALLVSLAAVTAAVVLLRQRSADATAEMIKLNVAHPESKSSKATAEAKTQVEHVQTLDPSKEDDRGQLIEIRDKARAAAAKAAKDAQDQQAINLRNDRFDASQGGHTNSTAPEDRVKVDEYRRAARDQVQIAEAAEKQIADAQERYRQAQMTAAVESATQTAEAVAAVKADPKISDTLRDQQRDAVEKKAPGFGKMRDFMDLKGATGDDVGQFAKGMGGNDAQAAELARLFAEFQGNTQMLDQIAEQFAKTIHETAEADKRLKTANTDYVEFRDKLMDLRGVIPAEQLAQFGTAFMGLREQFLAGKLSAEQYQQAQKQIDEHLQSTKTAKDGTNGLAEDITASRRKMGDMNGDGTGGNDFVSGSVRQKGQKKPGIREKAEGELAGIESQGNQLSQDLQNGKISAAQFSAEMKRLKQATDDVTSAAMAEEKQKRKEALMKGDFKGAGLDFNAAVKQKTEDRKAEQQQSKFDQAVDGVVNKMFPLGDAVQSVAGGMTNMVNGIQNFGQQLIQFNGGGPGGGGGGNAPSPGEAANKIADYLNSNQGAIDLLYNNIQMLQQNLSVVDTYQQQRDLLDEIARMQQQMNDLSMPSSPMLSKSGPLPGDDPGLQRGRSNNTINFDFPSINRITQSDADTITTRVMDELDRRGGGFYR